MNINPIEAWLAGAPAGEFTEPAQCKARADKFSRTIHRRNMLEYAAGAFVFIAFGATSAGAFWKGEMLMGISALLVSLGTLVVMFELHRRASNQDRKPEDACLVHLQKQYRRQYDALRAVPVWYIGPLVPGFIGLYASTAYNMAQTTGWSAALQSIASPGLIVVGVFTAVALVNWFGARAIKKQLTALDALT